MVMRVLDLFSGIGGFSLGLERAGMQTVAFCEIDHRVRKVLSKWWPSIPVWKDIRELNFCLRKVLKLSPADSPVRIYQWLGREPDLPDHVRDSGGRCFEPFAWYDRHTQSWRTWQRCLIEGWGRFSGAWPKAGIMRNGIAYRLTTSEHRTLESESGLLLPTPTVNGNYNRKGMSKTSGDGLITAVRKIYPTPNTSDWRSDGELKLLSEICTSEEQYRAMSRRAAESKRRKWWSTPTANDARNLTLSSSLGGRDSLVGDMIKGGHSGRLNLRFVEWLMGYPMGFTKCVSDAVAMLGLGNAVVPQIPEIIGRAIMETKERGKA